MLILGIKTKSCFESIVILVTCIFLYYLIKKLLVNQWKKKLNRSKIFETYASFKIQKHLRSYFLLKNSKNSSLSNKEEMYFNKKSWSFNIVSGVYTFAHFVYHRTFTQNAARTHYEPLQLISKRNCIMSYVENSSALRSRERNIMNVE